MEASHIKFVKFRARDFVDLWQCVKHHLFAGWTEVEEWQGHPGCWFEKKKGDEFVFMVLKRPTPERISENG